MLSIDSVSVVFPIGVIKLICFIIYLEYVVIHLIHFIVYFLQFPSLFRRRDRASTDGDLHSSPRGNGQRCSRHIVLHEPRRARPSAFSFGSFKSISGTFNLFCSTSVLICLLSVVEGFYLDRRCDSN